MKEVKLSLFVGNIILYTKNPKYPTKYMLELISGFTKVARWKISLQKSVVFPFTNNEISNRNKIVLFTIISKPMILRSKFNQGGKISLYWKWWDFDKRYWRHKRKENLCSWMRRNNTIKMSILTKDISWFSASSPKFQWRFHRNRKNNPKISMETQKLNSQSNPEEEEQRRKHHSSWFQSYTKELY